MSALTDIITSTQPEKRNTSLESFCLSASVEELISECQLLDEFRRKSENLYERVRALFFLYAIHRFYLPFKKGIPAEGFIPFNGYTKLLNRRFEEAIDIFLSVQSQKGFNQAISGALAEAYHRLGFQTLANQVRQSVRSIRGNQWMFRIGHPVDHPLRIKQELVKQTDHLFPVLRERTPVRMDLTHSGWSDIFFLGMDYPEGAKVLNISIDLCLANEKSANKPCPPVEAFFRVIDRPVLRLTSVDLGASAEITTFEEIFDFGKDYLGLLKAAVIASGIVLPGMEGADHPLSELLARIIKPGFGIELVSKVNDIPKGSRLAVSTNLLAALITVCMRATGQIKTLTGALSEEDRRLVAARAILGEWLGGSGGGWQDSGGVWPGIKLIQGAAAHENDPEFGVSKGRLLPEHIILTHREVSSEVRKKLQDSLVLVHGGMAQDVGPVLEMVTEKYLLRSEAEWQGRQEAIETFSLLVELLKKGNIREIGDATDKNFNGPIQTIIPWASNLFTEILIERVRKTYSEKFWGFWMLGGMSGGGMGFIFDPAVRNKARRDLQIIMSDIKAGLNEAVPFAMEPVVYDFSINENGTLAELLEGENALMPAGYYTGFVPELIKRDQKQITRFRRAELARLGAASKTSDEFSGIVQALFDRMLPDIDPEKANKQLLQEMLDKYGFDKIQHEEIRSDLKSGRIGLAQNRFSGNTDIRDAEPDDVFDGINDLGEEYRKAGMDAIRNGQVAAIALAAGSGSRWTKGAGVVKAINPFCKINGRHRTFIETHLAKNRRISRLCKAPLPYVFTTSYMTHHAIDKFLRLQNFYEYKDPVLLSEGKTIGLRMIPMVKDLKFAWQEMPQQILDEQSQKMLESTRSALINWAEQMGEGNDYTDNLPAQCLHPVGHWYELPNMLRNGTLLKLLESYPNLKYLMLHNIDTLGADMDPAILGYHILRQKALTVEVIARGIDDRGGGLARVDGQLRLVEGLTLPDEEIEFRLSYYNSNTAWIDLDQYLKTFSLERSDLTNEVIVLNAIRKMAGRMPTYVTLKEVKKRWGKGQEDIYPVAQFEKLWGDMTALPELTCQYIAVPRFRGQQLKTPAQLDGWLRDGSAAYVNSLCDWN
ncbi:MAG: UTP--glucose-1-phosphate uridylyltransferase [Calditrichaceae bacterium]|nr:UTP--glucose-1-phosphate uridylyltransferase [Calditrichaceae bacterium]MBN2707590.1 UTP--glucose-1-phosphate uridylyltransferase [Calditrichaceae bacterium]RQV93230.1 MAG: UTP--glucose-1-phosphate uridylyltransferase [Calditrichota bacterium]